VRAGVPLFGQVSRMTEQKGFALLSEAVDELAKLDAQFVFLGKGERRFEGLLDSLARRYPARFAVSFEYNEPLAHRIEAGADFFLMPSQFEPCGLNQMYSHRYGTVPIVRATGGLDDTVVDYDERTRTGTGFKFADYTAAALVSAIKRAVTLYRQRDALDQLSARIMRLDHSWSASARRTLNLYEKLTSQRRAA
jgi:starch synthase